MESSRVTSASRRKKSGERTLRSSLLLALAVVTVLLGARTALFANTADRPFRLAFSSSMFAAVNENDVRAAMKAWIMTIAQEQGIPVDPNPNIHRTVDDLIRFARTNPVDGFAITTPEFIPLSKEFSFDTFATGTREGRITEEYLLLVHRNSGLERLDQLAGRTLGVVDNPRMSLALIWLDTVLMEAKLKRSSDFFKQVAMDRKVAQVVLPVFFGKVESCLVTKESFEVMSALNPQLKQQLRALAVSPPVVPSGFAFLKSSESISRTTIIEAMTRLGDSPAGRQILELTQADRIEAQSLSCLDESLELLNRHRRLLKKQ